MCALTSGRFSGVRGGVGGRVMRDRWCGMGADGETSDSKVGPLSLVTVMAFGSCGYFSSINKKEKNKGRTKRRTGEEKQTQNQIHLISLPVAMMEGTRERDPVPKPQGTDGRHLLRSTSVWCVGQPRENCFVSAAVIGVFGNFGSCIRRAKICMD